MKEGKSYGGKRWVLRRDRNTSRLGDSRIFKGREFQTVGAAKEKGRRPISDFTLGILSNFWVADLREYEGVSG